MKTLKYPIELIREKDGYTVLFPDMPYGVTTGATKKEALENAADCLEEIMASLINDKKAIPSPSAAKGKNTVILSPIFTAKVLLYNALREEHISKAELARMLHWKYPQVNRLFDTHHYSHLSQLVAAAAALNKRFVIGLEDVK